MARCERAQFERGLIWRKPHSDPLNTELIRRHPLRPKHTKHAKLKNSLRFPLIQLKLKRITRVLLLPRRNRPYQRLTLTLAPHPRTTQRLLCRTRRRRSIAPRVLLLRGVRLLVRIMRFQRITQNLPLSCSFLSSCLWVLVYLPSLFMIR